MASYRNIRIFDTTLRDGEQALRSSLTVKEKLVIAKQLARLNVDIIEAGFPVSSPGDAESVRTIAKEVKGPIICGLARAVKKDIDAAWESVKPAQRPMIHTFIATSKIHVEKKFRKSYDEVIRMAVEAVRYARRKCDRVEFSPEDTGRTEREMLYRIVEQTIRAGATTINLPDTTGYTIPEEWGQIIEDVFNHVPNIDKAVVSVHCHNDLGLATANSLLGVLKGAGQIECTVNGLGERAGNCALEEVVMAIKTRQALFKAQTGIKTEEIMNTSRIVSHHCNMPVQPNKAVVGSNAFAHSAGIHGDGILKDRSTYEIMTPQSVGLKTNTLNITSRSGRHMVANRLRELGYEEKDYDIDEVYKQVLALTDKKGSVYDDDLVVLMEMGEEQIKESYQLEYLHATAGTKTVPTATVILDREGKKFQESACGDGPVSATYNAIERITGIKVQLEDYQLGAVTKGRDALGTVNIILSYEGRKYHGMGSSTDIVEASALSYLNGLNKIALFKHFKSQSGKPRP